MNSKQLDSRIEAFMARKMKQFPEIEKRYQLKYRKTPTDKIRRRSQVWLLSQASY